MTATQEVLKEISEGVFKVASIHDCSENVEQLLSLWVLADVLICFFFHFILGFLCPLIEVILVEEGAFLRGSKVERIFLAISPGETSPSSENTLHDVARHRLSFHMLA